MSTNPLDLHLSNYTFRQSGFLLFKRLITSQFGMDFLLIISITLIFKAEIPSRLDLTQEIILAACGIITFFAIKAFIAIAVFLDWTGEVYQIRHKEIIHRRGVLNVAYEELAMEIIEGITYSQSFAGRIFGYATIIITMRHNPREPAINKILHHIPHHFTVVEILEKAMRRDLDNRETFNPELRPQHQ